MANRINKNLITIPKPLLKKMGVVVLPLKEYEKLIKQEMEKEYIDKLVEEGLREEREGKTEPFESFLKREYPDLYEKYYRS